MNWDAIGAIGEILGALAVVGTLLYLALQMKQVRKGMHLQSYRDVNELLNDLHNATMTSPDLAKVLVKAGIETESLEPWEELMLNNYHSSFMSSLEFIGEHVYQRTVDLSNTELLRSINYYLKQPGAVASWQAVRGFYADRWTKLIDEQVSKVDEAIGP